MILKKFSNFFAIAIIIFSGCKEADVTISPHHQNNSDDVLEIVSLVHNPDYGIVIGDSFIFSASYSSENTKIYYTINGTPAESVYQSKRTSEELYLYDGEIIFENSTNPSDYSLTQNIIYSDTYFTYNFGYVSKGISISLIEVDEKDRIIAKSRGSYIFSTSNNTDYSIPIVCLSAPVDDLIGIDKQSGVYNSFAEGQDNKCYAYLEYYDTKANESFSLMSKIKLGGSSTRIYPCRTLNINFKKDENGKKNEKPKVNIFQNRVSCGTNEDIIGMIARFRLHSGGNNVFTSFFTDAFIQRIVSKSETYVATAGYRPCNLYINGEYWGLYGIREHNDEDFIEYHYGVDSDDVVYVNKTNKPTIGKNKFGFDIETEDTELGFSLLEELYQLLGYNETNDGIIILDNAKDWTNDIHFKEFCELVDIDSFIDLILIEAYVGNWDFMNNNLRMWRTVPNPTKKKTIKSKYADGKWRFILHDLDHGLYNSLGQQGLSVEAKNEGKSVLDYYLGKCSNKYGETLEPRDYILLQLPAKNLEFRKRLLERAEYIQNTVFETEKAIRELDRMENEIEQFYERRYLRWGAGNINDFKATHASHRTVLQQRPDYFIKNIKSAFAIFEE